MSTPDLDARLQVVRSHYRVTPWIRPRGDEAPLLRSWQRCRDAGMRESDRVHFELVSRSLLSELDDRHGEFIALARPEVDRLASALQGTGCTVLLFSPKGYIVDRRVHEATTSQVLTGATRVGMNVSERCVGTTAPAIALADGEPYLVGREAHFCANVKPFFCVAAPIDNPQGERVGALDITAFDNVPGFDIYSLVTDAAAAIENRLFAPREDRLLVRFHARAELVGTPLEAIVEVDDAGRLVGANRAAEHALCMTRAALLAMRFRDLFDRDLGRVFSLPGGALDGLVPLQTRGGLLVHARLQGAGLAPRAPGRGWQAPAESAPASAAAAAAAPAQPEPEPGDVLPCMRDVEWQTIERTLEALGGNVSAAARQLGISRNTIYRRRAVRA